jgi:hypothetical protein
MLPMNFFAAGVVVAACCKDGGAEIWVVPGSAQWGKKAMRFSGMGQKKTILDPAVAIIGKYDKTKWANTHTGSVVKGELGSYGKHLKRCFVISACDLIQLSKPPVCFNLLVFSNRKLKKPKQIPPQPKGHH